MKLKVAKTEREINETVRCGGCSAVRHTASGGMICKELDRELLPDGFGFPIKDWTCMIRVRNEVLMEGFKERVRLKG